MRAAIVATVMMVAGPALGQGLPFDCYEKQSAQLDDKKSDARSVAAAVVATCHIERFVSRQGRTALTLDMRRELERSRDAEIDMATAFVLRGRR